jgi:hypothetical protein
LVSGALAAIAVPLPIPMTGAVVSGVTPAQAGIQYSVRPELDLSRADTGSSAGACHRAALSADPVADDDGAGRITFASASQSCALLRVREF